MLASTRSGSRSSPRARMRTRAWRISSPTRNWRWLGGPPRDRVTTLSQTPAACRLVQPWAARGPFRKSAACGRVDRSKRARFLDHLEALDLVADLDVRV